MPKSAMADDPEGRSLGGTVRVCLLPRVPWNQPTNAMYQLGAGPASLFFRRILMPPLLYLRGVFWVLITSKRPTFVLGRGYPQGVWFLFSRRVCSEICACISGSTDFVVSSCTKPQVAWSHQRWSAFLRCTIALARHLGELGCVYCRVHAQPA